MGLAINLNPAALNASRNLAANSTKMGQSIERLSSGYKINRGSDDPAGLVISENLRAQIGGLGQAISNSQNAVNMVKTAEGALNEVNSLLRSMRDLAVHAANTGVNSNEAVGADQAQISSALKSLDRIASTTAFGDKKLLNGSAAQTASVVSASVKSVSLGGDFSGKTGAVTLSAGSVTAATQAKITGDAADYANAAAAVAADGDITINGTFIGSYTTAGNTVQDVLDDINAKTSETGVTAALTSNKIVLTSTGYGEAAKIQSTETGGIISAAAGVKNAAGADAVIAADSVLTVGSDTIDLNGWTAEGNTLKSSSGDKIVLADGTGLANGATQLASVDNGALSFQVGAKAGETVSVAVNSVASDQLGKTTSATFSSLKDIDVTKNAAEALKVIDAAISQVSKQRADLGAFQKNVLESNINSLGVAKENVAASESSIRDADMAAEMVEFTRYQILNQAGTAMLTQANQAPQQLLSLLR